MIALVHFRNAQRGFPFQSHLCLFEVFLDCSGRDLRELRREYGGPFFRVVRPSHRLSKIHRLSSVSDSLPNKPKPASSPEKSVSNQLCYSTPSASVNYASSPRSKVEENLRCPHPSHHPSFMGRVDEEAWSRPPNGRG